MSILYLCTDCCSVVGIRSNYLGENKVGRKSCYGCGDNTDWNLHVADEKIIEALVNKANETSDLKAKI